MEWRSGAPVVCAGDLEHLNTHCRLHERRVDAKNRAHEREDRQRSMARLRVPVNDPLTERFSGARVACAGDLEHLMLTVLCASCAVARRVVQATARNDSARGGVCVYR